ncbi:hypothetical protein DYI26_04940 [Halomonas litopenaei]|nr:hypothetical protein [Halomonas litopenaei]
MTPQPGTHTLSTPNNCWRQDPAHRPALPSARVPGLTPERRVVYLFEPDSFVPAAKLENRFEAVHTRSGTGAVLYTEHQPTEPTLYSIHTDHLGTPMELAECDGKSSGKLAWVGHYRAWGELTKASDGHGNPSTTDNPLRFQGQYLDEETGLHYNRHRYYDPETGRFTTQDPIGLAGGENLYMYAPNPTGWVDPLGLSNKCCNCLYRGVSANHPAHQDARRGVVKPANPNASLSPEQHAEGGLSGESQYVSWTPDKTLSLRDGSGGVLLSVPQGAPKSDDSWSWGWAHINDWGETEMLQVGTRTGVNVTREGCQ